MYYFIVNPHSRSGRAEALWRSLEQMLIEKQVVYEAHLTQYPEHAIQLAAALTDPKHPDPNPKIIIVLGGDGTLNEVLNGLCFSSPLTLGYIPTGSGNDFARSLKLPKNPKKALEHILNPKYFRYLDYGILSYGENEELHRRFLVSSGIGFDANVCFGLLNSRTKRFFNRIYIGKFSYLLIGILQLLMLKPCCGRLLLNGISPVELKDISLLSFHIQPYEGGGFCFAPDADPSDGELELCTVSGISRIRLIPVLLAALLGGFHKNKKGVRIYRCREASISLAVPSCVHTDGEVFPPQTHISVSCVRKKLRVIV